MLRKDPMQGSVWLWHKADLGRDWSIPAWYCHLHGVPPWYLTRSSSQLKKVGEKGRALAFLVRMNYMLDTDLGDFKIRLPDYVGRCLSTLGEAYLGGFLNRGANVTFALAPKYNWRRALSCVLRRFVNLAYPRLAARFRTVSSVG
jgi:hypothetical protein